ncbi:hypothetical protein GGR57DRAFT_481071 [Xylariaceae sp. FL1272]|nr:hypothetical protein GGR57DRAFT_481071 [Xylariaceae sp. FL1272]
MPQAQDNARVFMLIVILLWLASTPDSSPGFIAGPSQIKDRLARQRDAHAVLNSTSWGDFAPRQAGDPIPDAELLAETPDVEPTDEKIIARRQADAKIAEVVDGTPEIVPANEYKYLNLTGFRQEDGFAWEDLGQFKSRCEEWSRNAVGMPEVQQPVWQNATGLVRGLWNRRNATVTRDHSDYNLTKINDDVAWTGLNAEWNRNITGKEGKILVRIDDADDSGTEPEHVDRKILNQDKIRARDVSASVTIEDINGSGNSWDLRLHGIHWPKQGAMLFTTTSDKFAGIFGLPHLTTNPEFFESSKALLNRTLGKILDRKEKRMLTDQTDPWASTMDTPGETWNPTPHCEYLLYVQVHPLDPNVLKVQPSLTGPENVVKAIYDIEDELRFPLGKPQTATPRLQMSAVLYSPDCAFFMESKGPPSYPATEGEHLLGVKQEIFLHNVSTWFLGLTAIMFGQVQLLKLQMRETSTPSTLGRVSLYTAGMMLFADGIIFAGSAAWTLSASNTLLPSLIVTCVSFLSMMIGVFFVSEIHKIQEPEWRRQERERERQNPPSSRPQSTPPHNSATNPSAGTRLGTNPTENTPAPTTREPSPPIIIPSDQDIDAEIAEVTNSTTTNATLPVPVTAGGTQASATYTPTPITTIFGRFILTGICVLFLSLAAATWRPSLRATYFNTLAFIYFSLWIPQIYRNIYRNCRRALSWRFVVGQSVLRLLPIAYFYVFEDNFAFAERDFTTFFLMVAWVGLQIGVLVVQSILGPRFGVPSGWCPEAWEYHPLLREDNMEAGGLPIGLVAAASGSPSLERRKSVDDKMKGVNVHTIDCAICREVLEVPVLKAGESDNSLGLGGMGMGAGMAGVGGVLARRMYMVTPCRHIFHSGCLEGWMRFRLQCPICREELPPL